MRFDFSLLIYFFLSVFLFAKTDLEKQALEYYVKDDAKGLENFLISHEANNTSEAYYLHGCFYLDGILGDVNATLANYYFLKSIEIARSNNEKDILQKSLKNLADSFYSGDGIEQITERSLDYYLESAKLGYAPSMFNVAVVSYELQNYKAARYWMTKYCNHPKADLKKYAKDLLKQWASEKERDNK